MYNKMTIGCPQHVQIRMFIFRFDLQFYIINTASTESEIDGNSTGATEVFKYK